jgi:hypothetical protein
VSRDIRHFTHPCVGVGGVWDHRQTGECCHISSMS